MSNKQEHTGSGDNVFGNKSEHHYHNEGVHAIPHLITTPPSPNDNLIGREKDFLDLQEILENSKKVILMNGMGGIGKTSLAIEYANRRKYDYQHIVWLEQFSDFANDIISNYTLLKNLNISPSGDPSNDTFLILNKLNNIKEKSLLIIDNGEKELEKFAPHFPNSPNWHVLVTSRKELSFGQKMELDFLTKENAIALFYDHYKIDQNDELLNQILQIVDYHTLTIEILAKTAQSLEIDSIEKIAFMLKERGIKIGRPADFSKVSHVKNDNVETKLFPYLKSIFQIADLSDKEIDLLKKFVALPPVFISWKDILDYLGVDDEDETTKDNLTITRNKLRKTGWIIYDEDQGAYKLHRIIQDVLFDQIQITYEDIETTLVKVSDLLNIDQSKDNPVDKFQFILFGEKLIKILEKIDHPSNKEIAIFQSNLALVYQELGDFEKAKELLSLALQSDILNLGEDHTNTAVKRSNLALVYQDLGDYEKAKELLNLALQSAIQNLGEDHPNTAISRSNLAMVCKELGEYEKAKDLLSLALQFAIQNHGEDHPSTARRHSKLAMVYKDLGDYEKAKELLSLALQSDIQNFREDHPSTYRRRSNLALVYQELGEYEKAKELLSLVLQFDIQNLGENHPTTVISHSNLAMVYKDLGEYDKAKELLSLTLQFAIQNLGEDHPYTATSRSNLAMVYQGLGEYEKAKELLSLAHQSDIQNLGEDHPKTARRRSNLAIVYESLGDVDKAKSLFLKAYQTFRTLLGEDHPKTKSVKEWIDRLDK